MYGRGEAGSEEAIEVSSSKTDTKGKEFQPRNAFFILLFFFQACNVPLSLILEFTLTQPLDLFTVG